MRQLFCRLFHRPRVVVIDSTAETRVETTKRAGKIWVINANATATSKGSK